MVRGILRLENSYYPPRADKKHFGTNSAFKRKVARKLVLTDKFFPKEDTTHDHA